MRQRCRRSGKLPWLPNRNYSLIHSTRLIESGSRQIRTRVLLIEAVQASARTQLLQRITKPPSTEIDWPVM